MPKRKSPAGKGGAIAENPDTSTSIQPADYKPKDAISSVSIYSGRELIGYAVEFPTDVHCLDAQGQLLGSCRTQKDAVALLTATRGVRP